MAVEPATGPKVTVGGKTYELIGYDKDGAKVYQDAEVLESETAPEKASNTEEKTENATVTEKTDEKNEVEKNEQYAKIASEIKDVGGFSENATVHIPPLQVMIEDLDFDDAHINGERGHNVSREMAEAWIQESKASVTVWNGRFVRYYSENGVVYVDRLNNNIRTAYSAAEYDETTKQILEVLKKYGD